MKKIIYLAIFLFAANNLFSQTSTTWLKKYDSTYKYSYQVPSDWLYKPASEKSRFVVKTYAEKEGDDFLENVNLIARKLPNKTTQLEDIKSSVIEALQGKLANFSIVKETNSVWNKYKTYTIEYTGISKAEEKELDIKFMQILCIAGDYMYVYTYTSLNDDGYNKYLATAKKIWESIKLSK